MDTASAGLLGREMLAAERLEEAEVLLRHALKDPKNNPAYCQDYLRVLFKKNEYDLALQFISFYKAPLCHDLLYITLQEIILSKKFSIIDYVWRVQLPGTFQKTISTFWRAVSLYHQKDHEHGIDLFQISATEGVAAWNAGNRRSYVELFIQRGATLSKAQEIRIMEQCPNPEPAFKWLFASPELQNRTPITVISGDDRYVLRFAEKALEGLHLSGLPVACHIHIIGGSATVCEHLQALRTRFSGAILGITAEPVPGYPGLARNALPYFASARFLIARSLLKHYDADLIIADIDSKFTPFVANLTSIMEQFDIGFYQKIEELPWIDTLCGLVYVRQTDGAQRFLRSLEAILREKLKAKPLWMVDQGCLYSTALYFSEADVKVCNFEEETGQPIACVLSSLCTEEEKKALRIGEDL